MRSTFASTRRATAALGLLVALGACGGLGAIDSSSTVGRDGGLVESDDGKATVDVPAGATDGDVTLEPDGDGGYVLGPGDAELDEPATITVSTDEPGVPVRVGDDGTTSPVDDPTITAGPGGMTASGDVTEPGTYVISSVDTQMQLVPTYLAVNVGDTFTSRAVLTVTPDLEFSDRASQEQRLQAITASGDVPLDPVGQRVLFHTWSEPGDVVQLLAQVELQHRCAVPGRWSFGATIPNDHLPDDRPLRWHTGVVDCIDQAEGDTVTEEQDGEPVAEPLDLWGGTITGDRASDYLSAIDGSSVTADDSVLVRIAPQELTVAVGEEFDAVLDLWDLGRHTAPGDEVTATFRPATDGPIAIALGEGGAVALPFNDPVTGIPLRFRCIEPGTARFGAHVGIDYEPFGWTQYGGDHLTGNVVCVDDEPAADDGDDDADGDDLEVPLLTPDARGIWFPGGFVSPSGMVVRLHPSAFVAAVGEEVIASAEISLPAADPARPERLVIAGGTSGDNDVVGWDDWPHSAEVSAPGTARIPVHFRCMKEGRDSIGVAVLVEELGGAADDTVEMFKAQFDLGTGVCVKGGTGIPENGWMEQLLAGAGSSSTGGTAAAQDASLPATLQGPCQGRATIDGYGTIDPASSGGIYRAPRKGSAQWFGVIAAVPGEERSHSGYVKVHLPPPFPGVTIDSWSSTTDEVHDRGEASWDLDPLWTPAGVLVAASGEHVDTAGTCRGKVLVRIDGDLTDSATGPTALAFTVFALGIFVSAGIPKE